MVATARAPRAPRAAKPKTPRGGQLPPAVRAAMKRAQDTELIQIEADDAEGAPEPERDVAFAIGETVYTMLAAPSPGIANQALDLIYERGGSAESYGFATVFIMRAMLGTESYKAFLNAKKLTRAQYRAIVERVTVRAYSALEDEDGSPNS